MTEHFQEIYGNTGRLPGPIFNVLSYKFDSPLFGNKSKMVTTLTAEEKDKATNILTDLMKEESAYPFLEPVDHVALELFDYP